MNFVPVMRGPKTKSNSVPRGNRHCHQNEQGGERGGEGMFLAKLLKLVGLNLQAVIGNLSYIGVKVFLKDRNLTKETKIIVTPMPKSNMLIYIFV